MSKNARASGCKTLDKAEHQSALPRCARRAFKSCRVPGTRVQLATTPASQHKLRPPNRCPTGAPSSLQHNMGKKSRKPKGPGVLEPSWSIEEGCEKIAVMKELCGMDDDLAKEIVTSCEKKWRKKMGLPTPEESAKDQPPASSPKPLTFEEQQALAESIKNLPPNQLATVADFLKQCPGAITARVAEDDNQVWYNLEALDPGAARRLQMFVSVTTATQLDTNPALAITRLLLEHPDAELLPSNPDALRRLAAEAAEALNRKIESSEEEALLRERRISIAAAVAEAAVKDIPPSERVSDNERACNALTVLMKAILLDDDAEDKRNFTEYVGHFNGRVPPEEFVKIVKRWPRLRKYWPRLRRRFCSKCGKGTLDLSAPRLLVCGGCGQGHGVGRYCSVACQRKHWPVHQKHCPGALDSLTPDSLD